MGSIAYCYDNAVIESFWSWMQVELLDGRRWETRINLVNAICEYLKINCNRQRHHFALGMLILVATKSLDVFAPTVWWSENLAPLNQGSSQDFGAYDATPVASFLPLCVMPQQ